MLWWHTGHFNTQNCHTSKAALSTLQNKKQTQEQNAWQNLEPPAVWHAHKHAATASDRCIALKLLTPRCSANTATHVQNVAAECSCSRFVKGNSGDYAAALERLHHAFNNPQPQFKCLPTRLSDCKTPLSASLDCVGVQHPTPLILQHSGYPEWDAKLVQSLLHANLCSENNLHSRAYAATLPDCHPGRNKHTYGELLASLTCRPLQFRLWQRHIADHHSDVVHLHSSSGSSSTTCRGLAGDPAEVLPRKSGVVTCKLHAADRQAIMLQLIMLPAPPLQAKGSMQ